VLKLRVPTSHHGHAWITPVMVHLRTVCGFTRQLPQSASLARVDVRTPQPILSWPFPSRTAVACYLTRVSASSRLPIGCRCHAPLVSEFTGSVWRVGINPSTSRWSTKSSSVGLRFLPVKDRAMSGLLPCALNGLATVPLGCLPDKTIMRQALAN